MSNSISAAKKRRTGPLLSSPLFQPPTTMQNGAKPATPTYSPNIPGQQQRYNSNQPQLSQRPQQQQQQQQQTLQEQLR